MLLTISKDGQTRFSQEYVEITLDVLYNALCTVSKDDVEYPDLIFAHTRLVHTGWSKLGGFKLELQDTNYLYNVLINGKYSHTADGIDYDACASVLRAVGLPCLMRTVQQLQNDLTAKKASLIKIGDEVYNIEFKKEIELDVMLVDQEGTEINTWYDVRATIEGATHLLRGLKPNASDELKAALMEELEKTGVSSGWVFPDHVKEVTKSDLQVKEHKFVVQRKH